MAATKLRKIGSYEVERELAEGGMGVVYLARQPSLERPVVLKRMRRELAQNEEAEARFWREARSAASIHHPNVVCVYDCFQWRGEPYIACEYVEGLDAATAVEKAGALPPRIAALIALEIARGLDELHGRALVHRDLKPDNVLLGRAGEVKITDFGIAHDAKARSLTQSGISLGTPAYMSPEQLRGEKVDARSDLFALGVLLYELLSGRVPFAPQVDDPEEAAEEPSLLQRIERGHFVSLRRAKRGAPRVLVRLVARCLHAKPKRRLGSAAEACQALERYLGPTPPAAARAELAAWIAEAKLLPGRGRTRRAKPAEERPARRGTRRWVALAAAVAGLATVIAFTAAPRVTPSWTLAWLWSLPSVGSGAPSAEPVVPVEGPGPPEASPSDDSD